jgi:glycosyltransferase involved in cell wall biosynthesis
MENKKILVVSDFSFKGSGYLNIVVPLCKGLAGKGHEIKAVGFGYMGEEHNFPFSILSCASFGDAHALINNLKYLWNTDVVIVAMDIPHQEKFIQLVKSLGMKYIAITPLENPPLTLSWANSLSPADKVFFISELGANEAKISGLEDVEHLVVGMDTESWRERTTEEYTKGRELMNISPDTLVVITVADNQERKNLSKAFEIVGKLKKEKGLKVKYLLVTAEHSPVGWKLRDLAMTYGIASELMIFERGISFKELYSLYAISDVFLLTSKAEGLGMPVMEAMSVGVPVVATNCGAMPELLRDELGNDRGFLMETEYDMIDPWGNSRRDFPDADSGVSLIERINRGKDGTGNPSLMSRSARRYMESRTWDSPVEQVNVAVEKLYEQE